MSKINKWNRSRCYLESSGSGSLCVVQLVPPWISSRVTSHKPRIFIRFFSCSQSGSSIWEKEHLPLLFSWKRSLSAITEEGCCSFAFLWRDKKGRCIQFWASTRPFVPVCHPSGHAWTENMSQMCKTPEMRLSAQHPLDPSDARHQTAGVQTGIPLYWSSPVLPEN